MIWTESKFDKNAVSHSGAVGLMQILPTTAKWCAQSIGIKYNEKDLMNEDINVNLACFYLSYLIKKYNNIDYVIMAYNAGEGNVDNWIKKNIKKIPFYETRQYLKRVKIVYKIYNNFIRI